MLGQRRRTPRRGAGRRRVASVPRPAFDVALAVLTVHHWRDLAKGLAEMRRVAARQVLYVFDTAMTDSFWLVTDYFPEILELGSERAAPSIAMLAEHLDVRRVEVVPVPADCTDGFGGCYWNRPEAYLDPVVRAGMSSFSQLDDAIEARRGAAARRSRVGSLGRPLRRSAHAREYDLGYRIVIAGGAGDDRRVAFSSDVATRSSEGFAGARDAAALRGRRPRGRALVGRRLPRHHRRSARRRRAHPAPAGDPPLRRRRAVRHRDHRSRLDRGDRRRGHDARRAALLEGHRAADQDGARGRRRRTVEDGRRSARGRAGAHRVPGAHPPVPREARRARRGVALVRRDRGEDPRDRRRGRRDHRDRPRCAPRASRSSTRSSCPTRS